MCDHTSVRSSDMSSDLSSARAPVQATAMAAPAVRPLYLVVATSMSPSLGIGLNGTLPWPSIKTDMTFFARITRRSPTPTVMNTVLMGRKTYESVPPRYRPLQGRKNIVITRSGAEELQKRLREEINDESKKRQVYCVSSLQAGLDLSSTPDFDEGKVFVIGGAEIYKATLQEEHAGNITHLRVLQTEVQKRDGQALDIDTFFPSDLRKTAHWRQAGETEIVDWIGEEAPQIKSGDRSWAIDGDFKIRTLGWEKKLSST